ncbi:unnamed protein product [Vitrella brassicaformis CCMP3155]|uniref:Uncharacterized protein n=1 Tax=Vitrella brassicaformis (strain CCMP3155) TaxID=1169540 RepID=A0A0G4FM73_VITBC|nr:unnamed protein product [Vitrella brassicaformis CCMP3155]|eukprot:CEM15071.1 unnamed protein product [Vitrella brassicaformis CCMP3155]
MKRAVSLLHPNVSPPLAEPTNATADSLASRPKVKRHRPTTLFPALERDIQQGHIGADLPTNSTEVLCVFKLPVCGSDMMPRLVDSCRSVSVCRVRLSSSEWRLLEVDLQHTTLINIPQHEDTVCAEREAAADDELAREVCAAMANLDIVTSCRMFWWAFTSITQHEGGGPVRRPCDKALSIVQSLRIPG